MKITEIIFVITAFSLCAILGLERVCLAAGNTQSSQTSPPRVEPSQELSPGTVLAKSSTSARDNALRATGTPIDSGQLFPPLKKEVPKPKQGEPAAHPGTDIINPMNMGTIEYTEDLAPRSTSSGLSVVQALNEALVNGPRAAAVRAQFAVARANFPAATQQSNPSFFYDRGLMAEQVNRLGPQITYDPPWNLLFRLLIANRLVAQTKIDLLTTIWSLRADVRKAYVEVVVAEETLKTLEQLHELASRLLTVAIKRFQAGDVPELDVLKARVAAVQAEADVEIARKTVLRTKRQLNVLMGRPIESPLVIPPLPEYISNASRDKLRIIKNDLLPEFDRDIPSMKEFIDRALENRLELKSLTMQVKLNKANRLNAYSNVISDPTFVFGKSTTGNPPTGPKLTAVFYTLYAEFPTADFNQGPIYQYKAKQNQLKYQIPAQQNQVMIDVSSAYNNLIAARNKIRVYQEHLLFESEQVARLARRSYESGQSTITATLVAQQANVQTRNAYLDGVHTYASAFTDLELAVGKPLQ